jgi:hypothetical protein
LCSDQQFWPGADLDSLPLRPRRIEGGHLNGKPEGRRVEVVRFRAGEPAQTVLHNGHIVPIIIRGKKKLKEIFEGTLVSLDRSE